MNFYLVYGDDKGILNREIDDIKKKIGIGEDDVIFYSIEEAEDITREALTMSLFSSKKMLIIDSTSYLSEKKEVNNIKLLEDYFEHYNENSYLVFTSNGDSVDSRKKLVKLISSKGKVLKTEASNDYLMRYVKDYLKDQDYKMDGITITYFLGRSGNNIDNITNELDKLMLYKMDDKIITKEDVTLLVEDEMENSIYDLVGSILKDNKEMAMKLYNKFIQNGMDASQIIVILSSQMRLLLQVKMLYNKGKSNQEIADILEIRNIYRVKYLVSDSYYYTDGMLIKYISKLADMDRDIKLGKIDGNIFLQLFIIEKDM